MVEAEYPRYFRVRSLLIRLIKIINMKLAMKTQILEKSLGWEINAEIANKFRT